MKRAQYVLAAMVAVFYLFTAHYLSREKVPDFAGIKDVKEKKVSFFEYIYPHVEIVNLELIGLRDRLIGLQSKLTAGNPIAPDDMNFVRLKLKHYGIKFDPDRLSDAIGELLIRVDIVPPSLALAQSANESAWGTSRFAREGANYFGQWCFTKGCGMVPSARTRGAIHEVKKFGSVRDSVTSYINNLNSAFAYRSFRAMRGVERTKNFRFHGLNLAGGLHRYSERGESYVTEIREMIRVNRLDRYDDRFWDSVAKSGKY